MSNIKTTKNKFKSIFLCFLIFSSIGLASELWLSNSHSFFVLAGITETNEDENLKSYFFMPERILSTRGDDRFTSVHSFYVNDTLKNLNNLIKNSLSNNYLLFDLNYAILRNRGVFLEYSFKVPGYIFSSYFGEINLDYITGVFLLPSVQNSSSIDVYIFNSYDNIIKRIQYSSSTNHAFLESLINVNIENSYYVSSYLMGFNLPSNNFLLRWQGDFNLPYLREQKTYGLMNVFEIVSVFFQNPAEVFSDYDGISYRFVSNTSVLTFGDVLSYTNHTRFFSEDVDVLTNFNRARNFLNSENFKLILTSFTHSEGSSTFNFSKIVGGFKVYLDGPFATIVVDSGEVVYYTRKMPFYLSEEMASITLDAIYFIDSVGSENNISFGYKNGVPTWVVLGDN